MLNRFLKSLSSTAVNKSRVKDGVGRTQGFVLGVVAGRNTDTKTINARIDSRTVVRDIRQMTPSSAINYSPPLVGETVVIGFIEDNPNLPFYLGVLNNASATPEANQTVEITSTVFEFTGNRATLQTQNQIQLNSGGVTNINGTPVAVIGALDNNGDILITSGQ